MARFAIRDFQLGNTIYIGAAVYFYTVSGGVKTTTLATLYDGFTGSGTIANPVRLDSEGKFPQPVYSEVALIATVSGLAIPDHDTGIIQSLTGTPSYKGCVIRKAADVVNPAYPYAIPWDTEDRDTNSIHDNAVNPSRMTIPAGFTGARIKAQVAFLNILADAGIQVTVYKNGVALPYGRFLSGKAAYTNPVGYVETPTLNVVPTDYFEIVINSTDATSDFDASDSWAELELVE